MKISVDAAALCSDKKFGNYIFSLNLIEALDKYDRKNNYKLYSFCKKPTELKLNNNFNYKILLPRKFWLKFRISVEEKLHKSNIFLALNQAIPHTKAKIIAFSHGLSFMKYPKLYKDSYSRLKAQLVEMAKKADIIVVSSIKVKKEFAELYPSLKNVKVIPFGTPLDMVNKRATATTGRGKYFLYVGMDHPVKNIDFLKRAVKHFPGYKLKIAKDLSRNELKKLYSTATAYLTASHYESFNLPVLEALSLGCPVIGLKSAIIPEFYPYVNVADNNQEFISLMEKAIYGKLKIADGEKLSNEFSWKKYVENLMRNTY